MRGMEQVKLCHRPKCVERNDASSLQLYGRQSVGLPVTYQWTVVPVGDRLACQSEDGLHVLLAHGFASSRGAVQATGHSTAGQDGASWSRGGISLRWPIRGGELGVWAWARV